VRFQVPKIVNIELALKARFTTAGGDPNLLVTGGLTDKSWLLGGACKLQGGFALQAWFNSGDCVLTVGGYSPAFRKPERYPTVDGVAFRWALSDAIVLKGDTYFALTPARGDGRLARRRHRAVGAALGRVLLLVRRARRLDPFYFVREPRRGVWGRVAHPARRRRLRGRRPPHAARPARRREREHRPRGHQHRHPVRQPEPAQLGPAAGRRLLSRMLELRLPRPPRRRSTWCCRRARGSTPRARCSSRGCSSSRSRRGLVSADGTAAEGSAAKPYRLASEFEFVVRSRVPLGGGAA
jgi:hypothetical protein